MAAEPDVPKRMHANMNTRKRETAPSIWRILTSPASALVLTLIGYYSLAGLANVFLPDSSLGGIIIRALIAVITISAFIACNKEHRKKIPVALLPATIFFTLYFFRMYENVFISQLVLPPSGAIAILIFLVSLIMPSYLIVSIYRAIDDHAFDVLMRMCLFVFMVSLALNWEQIITSSESRLLLDKINPISMSVTAFVFLVYHIFRFRSSKRVALQGVFVLPILLFIIVYARSRGVYIAGLATFLIYGMILKGGRRIGYLVVVCLFGASAAIWSAGDALIVVTESLARIFSGTDLSANIRRDAALGGVNQFFDHPLFGRYIIELSTTYYVHNMYLESLMAVGLMGTMFLILHLVFAYRAAFGLIRSANTPFVARFSSVLMIFMSIMAASSGAVYLAVEFWVTSFLVITCWYGRAIIPRALAAPRDSVQSIGYKLNGGRVQP